HEYLNNIRLDYAQYLTRSTNDTLTRIWMDAGFESQRTFNRVFKEKYGTSPKDYRLK
ncbi:helix-turn-helix domain-containing protein, partial [Robinsoniella sp. RHS]